MTGDPEGAEAPTDVLAAMVRDPFAWHPITEGGFMRIREWQRMLSGRFPLWCLSPDAYLRFAPGNLPSTYPLAVIIESLLKDQGNSAIKPMSS